MIEQHTIIKHHDEAHSALRDDNLGGSEVAAVFGLDDYCSPLRKFHEKAKLIDLPKRGDSGPARRGRRYENAVAEAVAELRPEWKIEKAQVYFCDPELRLGSTPDFFIHGDPRGLGIMQAKTCTPSVFERDYGAEPEAAPIKSVLQTQVDMWMAGASFGVLAALCIDPYDDRPVAIREMLPHEPTRARIREAVIKFWDDVANGREPAPDYGLDRDLLAVLLPRETADSVVDLRMDNEVVAALHERADLKERMKRDDERCKAIETLVMQRMGDAERVIGIPDFKVSWKTEHRKEYTVAAKDTRVLRILDRRSDAA